MNAVTATRCFLARGQDEPVPGHEEIDLAILGVGREQVRMDIGRGIGVSSLWHGGPPVLRVRLGGGVGPALLSAGKRPARYYFSSNGNYYAPIRVIMQSTTCALHRISHIPCMIKKKPPGEEPYPRMNLALGDLLPLLDKWRARQPGVPTRQQAVRQILAAALRNPEKKKK